MSDEEYPAFRQRSEVSYAAEIAASRPCRYRKLVARPPRTMTRLLPEGVRTPGHYLWTAYEGVEPVEDLWLHVEEGRMVLTPSVTASLFARNFADAATVGR